MSVLILVEHDNQEVKSSTLNTVTAARQLGDDLHGLVIGNGCAEVAAAAARIDGIDKVYLVDSAEFEHGLVENSAIVVADFAGSYTLCQTHPTPVSYTHLTLPTICSV